jgi:hypothetical protein
MWLQFSNYTKNMYMFNKSSLWSKFNLIRVNLVLKYLWKLNTKWKDILEIWAYDLFFINYCLDKNLLIDSKTIDISDLYDVIDKQIVKYSDDNLNILKEKYKWIEFNKISQYLEKVDLSKRYDYIIICETLEHTNIELECIKNLSKLIKVWWKIIVSVPVEHWWLFFIKDLGRKILLWERTNTIKEMFYGLIWRTDKIERIIWWHKWYDFRNTKKMFLNNWFTIEKQKFYPFNLIFFGYWVVWEFRKK